MKSRPGDCRLFCTVLSLAAFFGAVNARPAETSLPTTIYAVAGLSEKVEILVDRWGVPHIYAPTAYAAYFAQGFNAARDRLWQLDLWRKRGLGELAADFGPAYVEQDRASRLFLFRGDMHAEWIAYSSDTKRIVGNFVAGINAYIALTRERPELLPPEFKLLGHTPALWQPEDVVRIRSQVPVGNLPSEVARARIAAVAGLEVDRLRRGLEPAWEPRVPEGLDLAEIPAAVLKDYNLMRDPVTFTPEKLRGLASAARDDVQHALEVEIYASNNFAVTPARSLTGRAILANDPHRVHGVPSLRYFVHLSAPGLDVIGAGEPCLPGISLGHNADIAFGLTTFAVDQEDLYVYETNPAQPDEYRYLDRWEPMRIRTESVAVKGGPARAITLKFTRHGPVLFEDPVKHRAYAARVAWLEPGAAPYLSSLEHMQAKNWDEFLAAMNRVGLPASNYLYADRRGNIGWAPSGFAPVRANWDGLLPVPGDGRYEWQGFHTMDQLPRKMNPVEGWIGTSNEMNLPADYDVARMKLGFEWSDAVRIRRQHQIFDGAARFDVAGFIRAQTDVVNVTGQRATALLAGVNAPAATPAAAALAALRAWDHRADRDSVGAAVFNVWYHKHVRPALLRQLAPAAAVALIGELDVPFSIDYLEKPDARLGPDPLRARNELFLATLESAAAELTARLGADPAGWRWGRLHQAEFVHPLSPAFPGNEVVRGFNVGPVPKAGDNETLGRSTWRTSDFRLTNGASARFVADVGEWDNTLANNTPGQSGDPRSPHYRDLFGPWANNDYFPLLYSRAAVEKAAEARIVLMPAKAR
ncbi:MAG: penicillin acylase family protein [Verrucomicrobia bacterium]|nr:penicillin acylase family protein [Verrucomicrobiota bacterium]